MAELFHVLMVPEEDPRQRGTVELQAAGHPGQVVAQGHAAEVDGYLQDVPRRPRGRCRDGDLRVTEVHGVLLDVGDADTAAGGGVVDADAVVGLVVVVEDAGEERLDRVRPCPGELERRRLGVTRRAQRATRGRARRAARRGRLVVALCATDRGRRRRGAGRAPSSWSSCAGGRCRRGRRASSCVLLALLGRGRRGRTARRGHAAPPPRQARGPAVDTACRTRRLGAATTSGSRARRETAPRCTGSPLVCGEETAPRPPHPT